MPSLWAWWGRVLSCLRGKWGLGWLDFPCFYFVFIPKQNIISKAKHEVYLWITYNLDYPCHNSLLWELVWSKWMIEVFRHCRVEGMGPAEVRTKEKSINQLHLPPLQLLASKALISKCFAWVPLFCSVLDHMSCSQGGPVVLYSSSGWEWGGEAALVLFV